MDDSDWFVLLLSPEAARSDWVNREVEYWLEHRDRSRIIPVVTDGEFGWSNGDVAGDAPAALHGAFADEPRWVDLRFARTEEQLDLRNASFRAAVADIASAIRGIPKDELESEEVRQHRRTIRTAWAAGFVVLLLAVVAVGAAIYANGQRITAEANEAKANAQTEIAEQQTAVAEQQTARAEQLALEARADALAANSIAQLDTDPEPALLLAVEALELEDQPSATTALHRALQQHRALFHPPVPPTAAVQTTGATGGISPDGTNLVVAGHGRVIYLYEIGNDEPVWIWEAPLEGSLVFSPRFTEDGSEVVVVAAPEDAFDPFRTTPVEEVLGQNTLDRLFVLDAATGSVRRTIDLPPCPWVMGAAPLSPHVDLSGLVPWVSCIQTLQRAAVGTFEPSTETFTKVTEVNAGGRDTPGAPTLDEAGEFLAAAGGGPGR